jgi:DNA-nicking Smr family endonuclease
MAKRQATSRARGDDLSHGGASHRPFAKLAKASRRPPAAMQASGAPRRAAEPAEEEPTDEDAERRRFAQLMRGVRPLAGARARRVPGPDEPGEGSRRSADGGASAASSSPRTDPDGGARERLEALVAEGVRFEVFDDGETLEGRRLDIDPREIRKLRQLRYAIDGTLDLHGLGSAEARQKLEGFLRRRRLSGDRAVVIVHGKGLHSPRGVAVLRGEIAAWLSQGKAQRDVAAFASVTDRLGGAGSVCVLLAR